MTTKGTGIRGTRGEGRGAGERREGIRSVRRIEAVNGTVNGERERERDARRNGTENEREGGEARVDGSTHAKGIRDGQRG